MDHTAAELTELALSQHDLQIRSSTGESGSRGRKSHVRRATRTVARIALIAALMVGVIAMHTFGHTGHGGQGYVQIIETAHVAADHDQNHDAAMAPDADEIEPFSALALLGFAVCVAVLARLALEFLRSRARSLRWGRLIERANHSTRSPYSQRLGHPPPRLLSTGLRLNRVTVLRI